MKNQLELIFKDDEAYADSRVIAQYFGKRHSDVMRDIRRLFAHLGDEITERNFAFSYTDITGRKLPCYRLDFDLAMTLITGYDDNLRYKLVKEWHKLADSRNKLRIEAKDTRKEFTDTLKDHGAKGSDYARITNNMKQPLEISLKCYKKDMSEKQIALVKAAESLATVVIDKEEGYDELNETCVEVSESVADLATRKRRVTA